ncbi:MAG: GGDEF domain-containing phosphodiesterase [Campylobacterota bacterium]|nr:GGDEF domain-containing phosphodiesterase [Campylobacterota bacterium]
MGRGTELILYRLGADEVVVLNPCVQTKDKFLQTIKDIVKDIEHNIFYFDDQDLEINISLHAGISFEKEHAIEKANTAIKKAKKEHLDYVIYDEAYQEGRHLTNIEMITKIKYATNNYGFIAYYQPIVDRDNSIIKYESLVRMRDNQKILSPFYFLDIAKKTKYYQHITRAVIYQAFKEFKDRDEFISVNLSADDIINSDTQDFIKNQLENFNAPQRVIFELVESEDIHDIKGIKEFISYIKNKGSKIAIDDFGTGYSNFSYLLDLEPDYLKIDGSLVKNVDTDKKSYDIVKTIVNFAHTLNIKVIAEYVHSEEVLKVCKELSVDEFQGYLFSEPLANPKN